MKNKNIHIVLMVVLLLVVAGGSFFGGTKYQQKKIISQFGQRVGMMKGSNNGQRNNGQMSGFRQTIGEISKIDDKSITLKTADGGSKIILISDSTTINQSTTVTKSELKVGSKIAVFGDQNTDGSITGKTINLNPSTPQNITPPEGQK
jgi:hypothetical protein